VVAGLTAACGDKVFTGDVDCNECYSDKPALVDLEIYVTIPGNDSGVPLVVYRGDIEDNQVEYVDTAYESTYYLGGIQVDKWYSVKAQYKKEGKILYAVDGTKPRTLRVTDACDAECYVIENTVLDVRIKKEFEDY